jgi:threonyl-tRNA synthetase
MPKIARVRAKKANPELDRMRHSAAHILAMAVLKHFPGAKLAIGPSISEGFYYDFDFATPISETDLPRIEQTMREIIKKDVKFVQKKIPRKEAEKILKGEPYKLELLRDIPDDPVSFYESGDFIDLCKGPHVSSTGKIGAVKLLSVAGAYWRGSEKNKMLTRIYGTAFPSESSLSEYLSMLEEAERRDHKKLGPKLGLFMFHETAPGMPYFLPNGLVVMNELIRFWREEHEKRGYNEIRSPLINKKELYETSGHWEHFRDDMFIAETPEKEIYALKPMNCPNAMVVFGSRPRSYRDLPLRLSDTDTLHRYERSGTLNGLFRVREFSQDDAHIFVTDDQIEDEYKRILSIAERFYSVFGMDYSFRLGTRPEKFLGDVKLWDKAESSLKKILKSAKRPFTVLPGDGVFYGPKIDILMQDSLGREWQMGTIQLDFQMPLRFGLKYTDKDGREKTPAVVHRVIYGTLERFIGILIEHFAGAFPVWLAPVQAIIIPIADRHGRYARQATEELKNSGIRVELDESSDTVNKKIRNAEIKKVPYALVVGDREQKSKSVAVRDRSGKVITQKLPVFLKKISEEIEKKK